MSALIHVNRTYNRKVLGNDYLAPYCIVFFRRLPDERSCSVTASLLRLPILDSAEDFRKILLNSRDVHLVDNAGVEPFGVDCRRMGKFKHWSRPEVSSEIRIAEHVRTVGPV